MSNLRIRTRLAVLTAVMALLLVAVAVAGLLTADRAREGLKAVYEEHTVAAIHLARVRDALQRLRLSMAVGVTNQDREAGRKTLAKVPELEAQLDKDWGAYLATGVTGAEVELVERFSKANEAYKETRHRTLRAYEQDPVVGEQTMRANGGKRMEETLAAIDALLVLQERSAEQRYVVASQQFSRALGITGVLVVTALVFGGGISLLITRSISRGINGSIGIMALLANGKVDILVSGCERQDEVGDIARALDILRTRLAEAHAAAEAHEAEMVERARRADALQQLAQRFDADAKTLTEQVSAAAVALRSASETMSEVASRSATEAEAIRVATSEASANVNTVAAASAELSASVSEISRQVDASLQVSQDAVQAAQRTDTLVGGLAASATRIGDVVQTITLIAAQTNLLALNATIEAARAGDAGKGFAVVAGEVKALANQTAKATEEISEQIGAVQSATSDAVSAIRDITGIINQISETSAAIAAAVEQQGAATNEIARSAEHAANGTRDISRYVDHMSDDAGFTEKAARLVNEQADTMTHQSAVLEQRITEFLGEVRGA